MGNTNGSILPIKKNKSGPTLAIAETEDQNTRIYYVEPNFKSEVVSMIPKRLKKAKKQGAKIDTLNFKEKLKENDLFEDTYQKKQKEINEVFKKHKDAFQDGYFVINKENKYCVPSQSGGVNKVFWIDHRKHPSSSSSENVHIEEVKENDVVGQSPTLEEIEEELFRLSGYVAREEEETETGKKEIKFIKLKPEENPLFEGEEDQDQRNQDEDDDAEEEEEEEDIENKNEKDDDYEEEEEEEEEQEQYPNKNNELLFSEGEEEEEEEEENGNSSFYSKLKDHQEEDEEQDEEIEENSSLFEDF